MNVSVLTRIKPLRLIQSTSSWSTEEVWKLLVSKRSISVQGLAQMLDKTVNEVKIKLAYLKAADLVPVGKAFSNEFKTWGYEDSDFLIAYGPVYNLQTLSQCLGRSECQIEFAMDHYGVPPLTAHRSHKVHVSTLKLDNPVTEAIQKVIDSIGEFRPTTNAVEAGLRTGKRWTEDEIDFLFKARKDHSIEEVASFLGRSVSAVNKKLDSIPSHRYESV